MINKVTLIGRTTKEPNVRTLSTRSTVASFTLACERSFKSASGERETDFIPIVAWSKTAELIGQYVGKGSLIGISGRVQTRSYENQNGDRVYITEIVADEVQFLSTKSENNSNSDYSNNSYSNSRYVSDDDIDGVPSDWLDDEDTPF